MADAIGQVLALGVGVALSPLPIIAVVLMLGTPRATSNGPAFLVGWVLGLAVVGTVVLLIAAGADASERGDPASWVGVVKLVLGVVLLLAAARQWRKRPRSGREAELPGWMKRIDAFTQVKSAGIAALLSGINPKNLILTLAAASAIAQTGASGGEQAVALAVFVALGTLGPGIPVAIYFFMRERAEPPLASMKRWLAVHNAAIMSVLCLLIGFKLIGDGIAAI